MPSTTAKIPAVFLDWAGTVVDHGSIAPVNALENIFHEFGVNAPRPVVRRYMGLAKKDHIRKMLEEPEVKEQWISLHHAPPQERDVEQMYAKFEPQMMEVLAGYATVISGVPEAVEDMRARGIKIAGTTGYTRPMLDRLEALAARQGYRTDRSLAPEDAGGGRPFPWMCYRLAIDLRIYPLSCVREDWRHGVRYRGRPQRRHVDHWRHPQRQQCWIVGRRLVEARRPGEEAASRLRRAGVPLGWSPLHRGNRCPHPPHPERNRAQNRRRRKPPMPPMNDARITRWHILTISLLFLGYGGYYFCRSDYSVALPLLIAEQAHKGMPAGVAQIRLGSIASLGVLAYAIGKFPSGGLADRFGGRRNFLGGMFGSILFTVLFMLGGGFPIFTLAWVGNRLVQSLGWAGLVKVTSRWFSYTTYGGVMGVLSLSYLFGDAASRGIMSLLLAHGFGWRGLFGAGACLLSVLLLCNLIFLARVSSGLPLARARGESAQPVF